MDTIIFKKSGYQLSFFPYTESQVSVSIMVGQGEDYSGHAVTLNKQEARRVGEALVRWSKS
jgi:hypothetical protein